MKSNKILTRRLLRPAAAALVLAAMAAAGHSARGEASVLTAMAVIGQQPAGAEGRHGLVEEAAARRRFRGHARRHHRQRGHRGQGQHQAGSPDKNPDGPPNQGPKQTGNRPDDKPGQTPGKNPDGGPRQTGNRPDNPLGRDHGGGHVVCVGGKVFSQRCLCHGRETRNVLRNAVFVCGQPGRQPAVPQIAVVRRAPVLAAGPVSAVALDAPAANAAVNASPPAQPQAAPPQPAAPAQFAPDQVLVTLPSAAPQTVEADVAQALNLDVLGRWTLDLVGTRLVLYRIPDGRAVPALVAQLQREARVAGPQPNFYYRPQAVSEPPAEAPRDLQYALVKLDIDHAHAIAHGRGVLVAVVDTEIDATHPDLAGAVLEKFDATDGSKGAPGDHGTSIAGIIRAHGLMRGVAPEARLLGVTAFAPADGKGGSPVATTASLLRGIDWAIGRHARVINMSFTGPRDALLEQGVQAAYARKAIVIAAAGNGGANAPEAYPAAYPDVIAVTATDVADHLYGSANQGTYIDVAAPGVDVLAPGLEHAHILQSGTSFAAAHISGIVALMLELNPDLDLADVRGALMDGARDLGPAGQDEQFGAGRADAFATLQLVEGH